MGIASNGIVDTSGGTDVTDATAVAGDILDTKTAYVASGKVTGSLVASDLTSDATAKAWDIKTGKTAYISTGVTTGTGYFPAMMEFGSTGYYVRTSSWSFASGITCVGQFIKGSHLGATSFSEVLVSFLGSAAVQFQIATNASDDAQATRQNRIHFLVQNSAAASLCNVYSNSQVCDNVKHSFWFEYDPSAGTAQLIIDGASDLNASAFGHTITTGTIDTGSSYKTIGARNSGSLDRYWSQTAAAQFGFFGVIGTTGLTYSDFFQTDGSPKEQDTAVWANSGFGAQPLVFNPHGDLVNNLGSAGAFTKTNTINVGNGGVYG